MNYAEIERRMEDALDRINGVDEDAVYELLHREAITGRSQSPDDCPIARYLKREALPEDWAIRVESDHVQALPPDREGARKPGTSLTVPTAMVPHGVAAFIQEFDADSERFHKVWVGDAGA